MHFSETPGLRLYICKCLDVAFRTARILFSIRSHRRAPKCSACADYKSILQVQKFGL